VIAVVGVPVPGVALPTDNVDAWEAPLQLAASVRAAIAGQQVTTAANANAIHSRDINAF
jgi:hypothetical protein